MLSRQSVSVHRLFQVRGNIDQFLQYDYVGAPWHWDNERWQHHRQDMPQGVGNGGLSLRSVAAMRELAKTLGPSANGSQQVGVLLWQHEQMGNS